MYCTFVLFVNQHFQGIVKVIQLRRLKWKEYLGHIGKTYNILVRRPHGNDRFEVEKRSENNIKMDVT
jgi:hypothetical protein